MADEEGVPSTRAHSHRLILPIPEDEDRQTVEGSEVRERKRLYLEKIE